MAFLDKTGVRRLWDHIVIALGQKVDKVDNMGLSTNDYTTADKNKLDGIDEGANKTIVDSSLSVNSTNPVQNQVVAKTINDLIGTETVSDQINTAISNKADVQHAHDLATTSADGFMSALDKERLDGLDGVGETINNITAQLGSLVGTESVSTQIATAINNIKIGGRNLLLGTGTPIEQTLTGGTNKAFATYTVLIGGASIAGEVASFSFDWQYIGDTPAGTLFAMTGAPDYQTLCSKCTISADNTFGHVEKKNFIVKEGSTFNSIRIRTDNIVGTIVISNMKLERGNQITDWTPAPGELTYDNVIDALEYEPLSKEDGVALFDGAIEYTNIKIDSLSMDNIIAALGYEPLDARVVSSLVAYTDNAVADKADKDHTHSGYLTAHPTVLISDDSTSEATPSHGGSFTVVDSVTRDTDGHVTKVNTKTVTLPMDTKVAHYLNDNGSGDFPMLFAGLITPTNGHVDFVYYNAGITVSPSTNTITATAFNGNATTATALYTMRYIDGISFNGNANVTRYLVCGSDADHVAKVALFSAGMVNLETGTRLTVKFTKANTAIEPSLAIVFPNADGELVRTDDIPIYWHNAPLATSQYWDAGAVLDFVYDDGKWELVGVAK